MAATTLSADQLDELCNFVRTYASAAHQNESTRRFELLNERLVASRTDTRLSAHEFDEYVTYAGSLGMSLEEIEPERATRFFSLLELLQAESS